MACFRSGVVMLAVFMSCYLTWVAAEPAPTEPKSALQPVVIETLSRKDGADAALESQNVLWGGGPGAASYLAVDVEFENAKACESFRVEGATVFHRVDRFANVFVDAKKTAKVLQGMRAAPGYVWDDIGQPIVAPPPRRADAAEKSRDAKPTIVRGGLDERTGKGVIIAVIDSGVDFRNPDFIVYDKDGLPTSRLLYFWDTLSDAYASKVGSRAKYSYPNGASIGTVFSREDLTKELRASTPRITVWDSCGHGTGCAGIAAGNGNNAPQEPKKDYAGVAPEADLIGVRIGGQDDLRNAYLLGAICSWINEVAGKQPVVVSCSFGGRYGGHDGYLVSERMLDALFPLDAKGRALCIAGGNDGDMPMHAEVTLAAKGPKSKHLKWFCPGVGRLSVYFQTDDRDDLRMDSVPALKAQSVRHALTKQEVWHIMLSPGDGDIVLSTASGKEVKADAYLLGHGCQFDLACATFTKQISTPATADHAITVGSYDFNDAFHVFGTTQYFQSVACSRAGDNRIVFGAISAYSNPGPRRLDGNVKPEIVAPGQWFTAAASMNTEVLRDTSGRYQRFNGTSAATPYAAGVIALMLQMKPDLTLGEIKDLLRKHATKDKLTGETPNPEWGYGKLDMKAVQAFLAAAR